MAYPSTGWAAIDLDVRVEDSRRLDIIEGAIDSPNVSKVADFDQLILRSSAREQTIFNKLLIMKSHVKLSLLLSFGGRGA